DGNFEVQSQFLQNKYGSLYEHYLMNFICRHGTKESTYKQKILFFVNDTVVGLAYKYTQAIYPDDRLSAFAPELNNMVKRFHYYFSGKKLPTKYITCTSGWNYAFSYMDSALSSSLDMYLGDTAVFYKML